jgi:hypothetical protein
MSDESSDNDNEINDDDDNASANNGNTIAEDGIAEIANDDDDDDDGRGLKIYAIDEMKRMTKKVPNPSMRTSLPKSWDKPVP